MSTATAAPEAPATSSALVRDGRSPASRRPTVPVTAFKASLSLLPRRGRKHVSCVPRRKRRSPITSEVRREERQDGGQAAATGRGRSAGRRRVTRGGEHGSWSRRL